MTWKNIHGTTRRQEILTGIILLGMTFGVFAIGEIGIRLVQYAKYGVEDSVESSSVFYTDEETGLRLIRPNHQLGKVRINNLGFRGPDVTEEKAVGVIRFLFLGSSTTYDADVNEGRNWPHQVINHLKDSFAQCQFDFINAAQPGFGTKNILKLYQNKLQSLNPDFVVVLPGDINQDLDWLASEQGFDTTHYRPSIMSEYSILWKKLEKNFRVIELQRAAFSRVDKVVLDVDLITKKFRNRLRQLTDTLLADEVIVFIAKIGSQLRQGQEPAKQVQVANTNLFYMPYVSIADLIIAREEYNKVINEFSVYNNTHILNSSLLVPANRIHYKDTMHFTANGSDFMAQQTFNEIIASASFQKRMKELDCI